MSLHASHLTRTELNRHETLLLSAFHAANHYDGSEESEAAFFRALISAEQFVQARNSGMPSSAIEIEFAKAALGDGKEPKDFTTNALLDRSLDFYEKIRAVEGTSGFFDMLNKAGALVLDPKRRYVKTDEGQMSAPTSNDPRPFEVRTQERLSILIKRLKDIGVYIDDLIIRPGEIDPDIMRQYPYDIIQIPRLDIEIAICQQIGEITFIKKGLSPASDWKNNTIIWDTLTKGQLKERRDIETAIFCNEDTWWKKIASVVGNQNSPQNKIHEKPDLRKTAGLSGAAITIWEARQVLLAHYNVTEKPLSVSMKGADGIGGSYKIEHGTICVGVGVCTLNSRLRDQHETSIAELNEQLAEEGLIKYGTETSIEDARQVLLAHYKATKQPLSSSMKGADGREGSYKIEHGTICVGVSVRALNLRLRHQHGTSIAELNEQLAEEGLIKYERKNIRNEISIKDARQVLLAHYNVTEKPLSSSMKGADGREGSYKIEHGTICVGVSVRALNLRLRHQHGTTIAKLSKELKLEYQEIDRQRAAQECLSSQSGYPAEAPV